MKQHQNMVRSPGRDADISDITTFSKLKSVLVEGFWVLVFQGLVVFFFWFLETQQLIILGIPDSSQLCQPRCAFPFLGPGLHISTPNTFPSPKLCSSL